MANKQKNRVNLTLDDELFAILSELSELSGAPKATIIHDYMSAISPQLKISIDLIKKLKANQMQMSDARQVFLDLLIDAGDTINHAQGQLNIAMREINQPTEEEKHNATDGGKSD